MAKIKYFQSDFPTEEIKSNDAIVNEILTKMYDNIEILDKSKGSKECKI